MAFSFSAVEILPALLDRSKTQTIRPVGKSLPKKVGSIHTLYWKQRTSPKGSQFCSVCGNRSALHSPYTEETGCCQGRLFNKILGIVEITEVFQIEMGWQSETMQITQPLEIGHAMFGSQNILARRDSGGLWTPQDMFNWFDKHYNLREPRKFWVYRYGFHKEEI